MSRVSDDFRWLVDLEKERQLAKWGKQTHHDLEWFGILSEEIGEVAKALNEHYLNDKPAGQILTELVQCAAVIESWIEDGLSKEERPHWTKEWVTE